MLKFNKLFTSKIISIIVIIAFTVTSTCYGIDLPKKSNLRAPLSGNTEEGKERFKHALLYEIRNILGNVVKADKEKDLEFYGEIRKALLLENGKILLDEELYDDYISEDLTREGKAVQAIIHELIEALLQVTKEQTPPNTSL